MKIGSDGLTCWHGDRWAEEDALFLADPCSWTRPHGPHRYGELRPNRSGTMSIVHPLYCPGRPEACTSPE